MWSETARVTLRQQMGDALRLMRKQSGLSLREVERQSRCSRPTILRAEKGDDVQLSTFLALAAVYQADTWWLTMYGKRQIGMLGQNNVNNT
jgi:transcriptional regulator with XRE-family HTH domain